MYVSGRTGKILECQASRQFLEAVTTGIELNIPCPLWLPTAVHDHYLLPLVGDSLISLLPAFSFCSDSQSPEGRQPIPQLSTDLTSRKHKICVVWESTSVS